MPHNGTGLRCSESAGMRYHAVSKIGDKFVIFTFPKNFIPFHSLSAQTPD